MNSKTYTLEDFFFELPEEQIAQYPLAKRDSSKLFVLNRLKREFVHSHFYNLIDFLQNDDLLVFNNARVIHARIHCKRQTGGLVEIVLVQKIDETKFMVISNRTKRLAVGEEIYPLKNEMVAFKILHRVGDYLEIEANRGLTEELLGMIGEMPLPPYIKRKSDDFDEERYQTIYASESGAVAAPTAGLHFTEDMLARIAQKGIDIHYLTLFVSWATFQPVRENDLAKHNMHKEQFVLPDATAASINLARKQGRRIIAVGTTSLRVLESTFKDGINVPGYGETDIFIYPPREVKSVNGIITNFHTPYSTLLMLVSAFAGYELTMSAYKEAVAHEYRFFSYGDAMLID